MAGPVVGPSFLESIANFLGFNDPPGNAPQVIVNTMPLRKPLTPMDANIAEMTKSIKDTTREIARELGRMKRGNNVKIRNVREAVERSDKAGAMRIAKDMVADKRAELRLEHAVTRMNRTKDRMQAMRANTSVVVYFKQSVKIIQDLNAFVQPERIEELSRQMAEEMEKFNMTQETMDGALEELDEADAEAFGEDEDALLSSETIVEQIAAECGLALSDLLPTVPDTAPIKAGDTLTTAAADIAGKKAETDGAATADDDLSARLKRLQKKK
jgi:hypothetical protein